MNQHSQNTTGPALLGEALLNAIRQAVREEINNVLGQNGNGHGGDRLLDPAEAAAILGMSKKWLYNNAHKLPFTRKLGRKTLRFSHLGIQKYLASRITLPTR
jgi:predicted DNA-binding transcriptional regulator AlpA